MGHENNIRAKIRQYLASKNKEKKEVGEKDKGLFDYQNSLSVTKRIADFSFR